MVNFKPVVEVPKSLAKCGPRRPNVLMRKLSGHDWSIKAMLAGKVRNSRALSLGRPQRSAVVASPAYLAQRPPPRVPTDLLGHDCIRVRLSNGALYRWHFQRGGETVQIDVPGRIILDEASLARAAVLDSAGIGYFMEQDITSRPAALLRVLEDWTPASPGFYLYYPGRRNPSAGLKAFLVLAREIATRPLDAALKGNPVSDQVTRWFCAGEALAAVAGGVSEGLDGPLAALGPGVPRMTALHVPCVDLATVPRWGRRKCQPMRVHWPAAEPARPRARGV